MIKRFKNFRAFCVIKCLNDDNLLLWQLKQLFDKKIFSLACQTQEVGLVAGQSKTRKDDNNMMSKARWLGNGTK